ncbi:MAG: hypothetical protein LBF86_06855 [Helicobacteraceae bacterium]|jgi:hypothetical protein|nr:hypothetical protein [Helicobacteraceae bacterium]
MSGYIGRLLFPLLRVAYAGIYLSRKKASLHTRIYQNRKLIKEERREFEAPNGVPSRAMFEYLQKLEKRSAYVYVAAALASINQGALPSCDPKFFRKMRIETDNISTVYIDDKWSIYASVFDLEEMQKKYAPIDGLDYIFPTEAVIDYYRRKIKIENDKNDAIAFLLYAKSSSTLAIYQNDAIMYSSHIIFDEDDENEEANAQNDMADFFDETLSDETLTDNAAELSAAGDDFGSIEDLNDFIASDDPSILDAPSEPALSDDQEAPELDLDENAPRFNMRRDMLLFNFLKNSFTAYYKNENFASAFINFAAVFEGYEGAKSAMDFLKKELCIDAKIYPIDIDETVCKMAYDEAAL